MLKIFIYFFLLLTISLTPSCVRKNKNNEIQELPAAWQQKANRGIDFLAIGNEPNWFLEIDFEQDLMLRIPEGDTVSVPVPYPVWEEGALVLRQTAEKDTLTVKISTNPCSDQMSDRAYLYTVTATFASDVYEGCGVYISHSSFSNIKPINE